MGDENTICTLIGFAADEDAKVRLLTLQVLGNLAAPGDAKATAVLTEHLSDSAPDVLEMAEKMLVKVNPPPPPPPEEKATRGSLRRQTRTMTRQAQ